jgi:5-methylthioadenosine/S-adenosylhomocysteine deaminase
MPTRYRLLALVLTLSVCVCAACAAVAVHQPAGRRPITLVVSGGTVVTMDPARRVLSPGAVAIDGTDIVAVDSPEAVVARFKAAETIDATGQVVLPGLVNTHTHAAMVMFRGLADDLALMEWLERYIFPAEAKTVSAGMVRTGTELALLEMIRSGTTTFADMYYFEEEVGRAAKRAGVRAVVGETIIGFPVPDAKTPADSLKRTEAMAREFANDPLITAAVAPHSPYTLDKEWLQACRSLADRYRIPILTHVAETEDEVRTMREKFSLSPVGYLASIGVLGPRVVAAHGVWVSDEDIATLKRFGIGISHNPESNMKLASGTAPVPKYLAAGVVVGLGTDGAASNNDLDMIEAMRQAAFLHKLESRDPRVVPAPVALEMATIAGSRILGLGDLVGSLEPGKKADVITVSMKGPRQTPMYNPVSHLVYVSRGDDVENTIVNGRVLMRKRTVLTLDEPAVLAAARKLAEQVKEAVRRQPAG